MLAAAMIASSSVAKKNVLRCPRSHSEARSPTISNPALYLRRPLKTTPVTEPDAESAAWIGLSVVGSPILPIYISFFLSTETRATVQRATAVTAASSKGIPTIRTRTRDIPGILSVGQLSASQKEANHACFAFAAQGPPAIVSPL